MIEAYGKIPPQNRELEEAVLAAMLIESDCAADVFRILKDEHFYSSSHQLIFSAMVRLFAKGAPIDILTVAQDLKESGSLDMVGGAYYIATLSNKVGSSANVEYHCTIVKEQWMKRAAIALGSNMIKDGFDDSIDPIELIEKTSAGLDAISHEASSNQVKDFSATLIKQIADITEAANKPREDRYIIGHRTGIYTLDRKILGYTSPDLIIIAARPAEGKTTLAVQGADANLALGVPVGFFSLEMTMEQLILKLLSMHTDIGVDRIRSGALKSFEWDMIHEAKKKILNYPFHVYDKPCTPDTMKAVAKVWKKKYGIEMMFFDYIQRAQSPKYLKGATMDVQTGHVSNTLKDIALELEIPVIALSQMSRDIEKRTGGDKRPQLSDLRNSGTLEADADIVIFPFRPEIHNMNVTTGPDGMQISSAGITEVIIEKHRLGSRGTVFAKFIGNGNRFADYDSTYSTQKEPDTPF